MRRLVSLSNIGKKEVYRFKNSVSSRLLLLSFCQFFWCGLFVCLRMFCDMLFRGVMSFFGV